MVSRSTSSSAERGPHGAVRPHPRLRGRTGAGPRRQRLPDRAARRHPRAEAVRRRPQRALLPARPLHRPRAPPGPGPARRCARRSSRWPSATACATSCGRPTPAGGSWSWCPGSPTASTTCSSAPGSATCRRRSSRWSPTTPTTGRWWSGTGSRSSTCRSAPGRRPEAEARLLELVDRFEMELVVLARYMQILSDDLTQVLTRAGHQHPPLLPAGLQGRQALPPGLRARREDRRCDGALRQPPSSTRGRSSPSRCRRWTTRSGRSSWWRPAGTPSARRCPTPSAGTARAG